MQLTRTSASLLPMLYGFTLDARLLQLYVKLKMLFCYIVDEESLQTGPAAFHSFIHFKEKYWHGSFNHIPITVGWICVAPYLSPWLDKFHLSCGAKLPPQRCLSFWCTWSSRQRSMLSQIPFFPPPQVRLLVFFFPPFLFFVRVKAT